VIDGCQMDLEQTATSTSRPQARTATWWPAWSAKSRRASSARPTRQTTAYAHKLGLAFQLTNIIRDVGEDAMRGRIYLPVNELQQFDVKAHEILKRQYSDRFTR
jgi:phytoene synthase